MSAPFQYPPQPPPPPVPAQWAANPSVVQQWRQGSWSANPAYNPSAAPVAAAQGTNNWWAPAAAWYMSWAQYGQQAQQDPYHQHQHQHQHQQQQQQQQQQQHHARGQQQQAAVPFYQKYKRPNDSFNDPNYNNVALSSNALDLHIDDTAPPSTPWIWHPPGLKSINDEIEPPMRMDDVEISERARRKAEEREREKDKERQRARDEAARKSSSNGSGSSSRTKTPGPPESSATGHHHHHHHRPRSSSHSNRRESSSRSFEVPPPPVPPLPSSADSRGRESVRPASRSRGDSIYAPPTKSSSASHQVSASSQAAVQQQKHHSSVSSSAAPTRPPSAQPTPSVAAGATATSPPSSRESRGHHHHAQIYAPRPTQASQNPVNLNGNSSGGAGGAQPFSSGGQLHPVFSPGIIRTPDHYGTRSRSSTTSAQTVSASQYVSASASQQQQQQQQQQQSSQSHRRSSSGAMSVARSATMPEIRSSSSAAISSSRDESRVPSSSSSRTPAALGRTQTYPKLDSNLEMRRSKPSSSSFMDESFAALDARSALTDVANFTLEPSGMLSPLPGEELMPPLSAGSGSRDRDRRSRRTTERDLSGSMHQLDAIPEANSVDGRPPQTQYVSAPRMRSKSRPPSGHSGYNSSGTGGAGTHSAGRTPEGGRTPASTSSRSRTGSMSEGGSSGGGGGGVASGTRTPARTPDSGRSSMSASMSSMSERRRQLSSDSSHYYSRETCRPNERMSPPERSDEDAERRRRRSLSRPGSKGPGEQRAVTHEALRLPDNHRVYENVRPPAEAGGVFTSASAAASGGRRSSSSGGGGGGSGSGGRSRDLLISREPLPVPPQPSKFVPPPSWHDVSASSSAARRGLTTYYRDK